MPVASLASLVIRGGLLITFLAFVSVAFEIMRVTSTVNSSLTPRHEQSQTAYGLPARISKAETARLNAELRARAAPRGAVIGSAKRVTVAALLFSQRKRDLLGTDAEIAASAANLNATAMKPLDLAIDFAAADREALIVLTDDAVRLDIAAERPINARAALGIESASYPDVSKVPAGVIGGFKVGDQGSTHPISPRDLADISSNDRFAFCRALTSWANHYGLNLADLEYVLFEDASALRYTGREWVSDTATVARYDATDFKTKCR